MADEQDKTNDEEITDADEKAEEVETEDSETSEPVDVSNLSEDELTPEKIAEEEAVFDFGAETDPDEKTDYGLMRPRTLEIEMQESYLSYAMTVIISRALPDVRDGLKPVHRRVLFSMHELGLSSKAKFRKCATVVGDVLGKYHPHGDVAVYDTLARMAQDFSMRYRLVDGQGNFGSIDGDSPAAMRYTEARMASMAEELLTDIEKDTVDFVPNYDGTRQEPRVLPSRVPNLLLNGAMGIAVGMATNIPPHNLTEIIDGTIHVIDNPECTVEDLMQFVKGPDFPTGAEIYGLEQIKAAYTMGKGSIVMRAVANIEEVKRGGFRIIISEIPYQVNKAELILKIADLVKDKRIDGISGLRDESDRTEGVRIVIDLKSSAYPKKILNRLYDLTPMQTAFHVNMLALIDGIQPRVLTLKNVLEEYVKHRQKVIRRRVEYDLRKAKERAHILEGLRIALARIDEVITVIKKSANREEALKALVEKFELTLIQGGAILDMRLSALAALEVKKIEDEYQALLKFIGECETILSDEKKILAIIKKELIEVRDKFKSERKTKIFDQEIGKFRAEDLIPSEQVIVMLSKGNYIKRMPVSAYRSQVRGGKGVMGMETKEEDTIEHLVAANTHDDVLFFTDRGRLFQAKVYDIPSASRISKGQALVNILQMSPDEKVTAVITLDAKNEALKYFVMATEKGVIKKTEIELYKNVRKTGIVAIKLGAGDKLKWVKTTSGTDKIFMASSRGQSILYNETDIRPMGRSAAGVRGILLKGEDKAVGIDVILPSLEEKAFVLVVMENGLGKRTPLTHFKVQLRGGMGIRVAAVTARTGKVVAMHVVYGDKVDVILATKNGQMIRMPMDTIKILSRDTQGVTLVKLKDNDKVASVTVVTKSAEELVQQIPGEEAVVQVPQKEDRPVQEVPKLQEFDTKAEIEREAEEMKLHSDVGEGPDDDDSGESGTASEESGTADDKNIKAQSKKTAEGDKIVKDEYSKQVEVKKTDKLPEWAKSHKDTWREPSVTKLGKTKVHDYKEGDVPNPEDLKKNLKKSEPEDQNYWGAKGDKGQGNLF